MNVSAPIRSIIPSLDGPVLAALAGTTAPLSTLEVRRLVRDASVNGVRRVLERLTEQGVVLADRRDHATYYIANRDHLAWPAVEILTGMRRALLARLAEEIGSWAIPAVHASLFGSAARADGDPDSDIDILLVRAEQSSAEADIWDDQVSHLRDRVAALTGNHVQTFEVTRDRLTAHVRAHDPLVEGWLEDGIRLTGDDLRTLVASIADQMRA